VLLDGAGIVLSGERGRIVLNRRYAVATLDGSDMVRSELPEGAVRIFNMMVRGTEPAAILVGDGRPLDVPSPAARPGRSTATGIRLVFAAVGAVECRVAGRPIGLSAGDALALDDGDDAMLQAIPAGNGCALVALIDAAEAA
jgi:environmental stress-induced protein Ves